MDEKEEPNPLLCMLFVLSVPFIIIGYVFCLFKFIKYLGGHVG